MGGITIKAADWSSESVFTKFYYKPTRDVSFGEAVLSTSNQATNNTVDIETEHSDIREYGSTLYVGMARKKNGRPYISIANGKLKSLVIYTNK